MKNKQSAVSSQQSVLETIFLLLLVNCILLTVFVSCDDKTYQPKPKGYFRIDLPEKEYVSLDSMKYYSFEHPVYSKITPDYLSPEEKEWVNVEFPSFKGTIHISYKNVDNNIEKYLEDSYYMMTKHISRAMGIRDSVVANP